MSRIFLTGDKHFPAEYKYLSFKHWPLGHELSREDYVIILGDFGICWDNSAEEKWWLNWFEDRPWTTLWIDGNHQNFPLLYSYPEEKWNGGMIHVLRPHIKHLCRGEIFNINNFTFFTFGGAASTDKHLRTEGKSWWPEEIGSYNEFEYAADNLRAHNMKVDYILSHTTSKRTIQKFDKWFPQFDPVTNFLDKFIEEEVDYKINFFGHFHQDRTIDEKHVLLYNDIIELLSNDEIKVVNN